MSESESKRDKNPKQGRRSDPDFAQPDSDSFPFERYEPIGIAFPRQEGEAWVAEDRIMGGKVLIRTITTLLRKDEQDYLSKFTAFQSEATRLCKLNCKSIPETIDFGACANGAPYLVSTLPEGRILKEIIEESGILAADRSIAVFTRVAEALSALHSVGILHRMIDTENIIVAIPGASSEVKDTQVYLLESGSGSLLANEPDKDKLDREKERITATPAAPEQLASSIYEPRSEIFTLGIAIFESLTGKSPFPSNDREAMIKFILRRSAPSLAKAALDYNYPPELERLVAKCLARDIDSRFQSMDELKDELVRLSKKNLSIEPCSHRQAKMPIAAEDAGAIPEETEATESLQARADRLDLASSAEDFTALKERSKLRQPALKEIEEQGELTSMKLVETETETADVEDNSAAALPAALSAGTESKPAVNPGKYQYRGRSERDGNANSEFLPLKNIAFILPVVLISAIWMAFKISSAPNESSLVDVKDGIVCYYRPARSTQSGELALFVPEEFRSTGPIARGYGSMVTIGILDDRLNLPTRYLEKLDDFRIAEDWHVKYEPGKDGNRLRAVENPGAYYNKRFLNALHLTSNSLDEIWTTLVKERDPTEASDLVVGQSPLSGVLSPRLSGQGQNAYGSIASELLESLDKIEPNQKLDSFSAGVDDMGFNTVPNETFQIESYLPVTGRLTLLVDTSRWFSNPKYLRLQLVENQKKTRNIEGQEENEESREPRPDWYLEQASVISRDEFYAYRNNPL